MPSASEPISSLPAASTVNSTDLLLISQDNGDGTYTSKKSAVTTFQTATGNVTAGGSLTSFAPIIGTGGNGISALTAMTNGQIMVGRTGLAPLIASVSGDGALSNTGALTISKIGGQSITLGGAFSTSVAVSVPSITGTGSLVFGTSPTITTANLVGTGTNNNAAAGSVGEIITGAASTPGTSLTTGTAANVTSISLTAGDWDVNGIVVFTGGNTTNVTFLNYAINTTSATLPTSGTTMRGQDSFGSAGKVPFVVGDVSYSITASRLSLNATTTVYLVASGGFTVSTMSAYGQIRARRIR